MMNDNPIINPNSVAPQMGVMPSFPAAQATPDQENVEDTEEAKLARESEVGEHDIVIDEDFEIKLEVSEVSPDIPIGTTVAQNQQAQAAQAAPVNLGTEQTGSITF